MLSNNAKETLKEAGFTTMEIGEIDSAQTVDGKPQDTDINAEVWKDAIESREKYVAGLEKEGWDKGEIEDSIDSYYAGKEEASPWDFIKIEYRPAKKLADFAYAAAQEAKRRIDEHFGTEYAKEKKR